MLYEIHEKKQFFKSAISDMAFATAKLFENPLFVFNPVAKHIAASCNLVHRLNKNYKKPEFGITSVGVDGVQVLVSEAIEINKPFCHLRRFNRWTTDLPTLEKIKDQPIVLIVAPLSGHHVTLLRDTVKTMLGDHTIYITDWKDARNIPLAEGDFHLDDYVNYVQEFIRHLQAKYGNCHIVSVCQPTVPVLGAVSLMASRGELAPLSMTVMGGPIDARKSPTSVDELATDKSHGWFERNVIYKVPKGFPGEGRRVYPGFLQHTGFIAMNPENHANRHITYYNDLVKGDEKHAEAHRAFYDEYNAVLDMDAHFYLETIKVVFQDFNLALGTWDIKGVDGIVERVRPQDISKTAIFSVEGELDDIAGIGQTKAIHTLCTGVSESNKKHLDVPGSGHYGIFSGHRWHELVYPEIRSFIIAHQRAKKAKKTH